MFLVLGYTLSYFHNLRIMLKPRPQKSQSMFTLSAHMLRLESQSKRQHSQDAKQARLTPALAHLTIMLKLFLYT